MTWETGEVTVTTLCCDGCGEVHGEVRAPFGPGDDFHILLESAEKAGWEWRTGNFHHTHHWCANCVAAGKHEEAKAS